MRLGTIVNKSLDFTMDALAYVAAFLLAFVMVTICIDVVLRYFFLSPMMWVTEVTEYSLLWVTFLGTAWLLKKKGHVIMDLVVNRIKSEYQTILNIIMSIIGVIICLVITAYGIKVILDVFNRQLTLSTLLTPPAWVIFIIIPIGSFLLTVQFIRMIVGYVRRKAPDNTEKPLILTQ
jgi:C4-dicarboxylate transporter DctQ subunit